MAQIRTIENINMNELALQLDTLLDVQATYEPGFICRQLEGIIQTVKDILDAPVDSEIEETPMLPAKEALSIARVDSRRAPSGASGTLTGRVASPDHLDEHYIEIWNDTGEEIIAHEKSYQDGSVFRRWVGRDGITADWRPHGEPPLDKFEKVISDGSTASYYELPEGATELQDIISAKNMNSQIGEIFRSCMRYGQVSHSDKMRDAKKILFYAQKEVDRLKTYES